MENLMGQGVQGGLGEVEEASETDDETVYFAECLEAEDFSSVVTIWGGC